MTKREYCPTCHRALVKPPPKVRRKARRVSVNRDPGYRRWCRTKKCVACLAMCSKCGQASTCEECPFLGPSLWIGSDPAHTQNNGMRSKGPDSSCVPLCRAHHDEFDAGRAAFQKKYAVDLKQIAAEHYERYLTEQEQENHADAQSVVDAARR